MTKETHLYVYDTEEEALAGLDKEVDLWAEKEEVEGVVDYRPNSYKLSYTDEDGVDIVKRFISVRTHEEAMDKTCGLFLDEVYFHHDALSKYNAISYILSRVKGSSKEHTKVTDDNEN